MSLFDSMPDLLMLATAGGRPILVGCRCYSLEAAGSILAIAPSCNGSGQVVNCYLIQSRWLCATYGPWIYYAPLIISTAPELMKLLVLYMSRTMGSTRCYKTEGFIFIHI